MIGKPSEVLDKLGRFLMSNWRDPLFRQHRQLMDGKLRSPTVQTLQTAVAKLPPETKTLIDDVVADILNTATHDLLCALQEAHDRKLGIELMVDGKFPAEISGMLHGEIQGPGGWITRFSEYKVPPL